MCLRSHSLEEMELLRGSLSRTVPTAALLASSTSVTPTRSTPASLLTEGAAHLFVQWNVGKDSEESVKVKLLILFTEE